VREVDAREEAVLRACQRWDAVLTSAALARTQLADAAGGRPHRYSSTRRPTKIRRIDVIAGEPAAGG